MKKILLALFVTLLGFSQKGTVSGVVLDGDFDNSPIPFANVLVKGTSIGTTSDEDGKYELSIDAGKKILVFSFLGYETVEVPVTIVAGKNIKLDQVLVSGGGQTLDEVVLVTTRRKNTEAALVAEIKQAKQVISAISAEQISKGTDGNAAQAVQRVPGIAIKDGKYIIIRGLSERYNQTMINNAIAPSTEVDRRSFSFDLIPSSVIERMVITKSGAAYLPGDFSGGLVNVTTSENFNDFIEVGFSLGYRDNTTFEDYFQTKGAGTDFLGFDNGFRKLPKDFPSKPDYFNSNVLGVEQANRLPNNFEPEKSTAFLNTGLAFTIGRNINFNNGGSLSTVNKLLYSNDFENYVKQTEIYISSVADGTAQDDKSFQDSYFKNQARMTLMSNWSWRINPKNKISFKNLYNQLGLNSTIIREGLSRDQRPGEIVRNYQFGFNETRILTSQFNGDHDLSENKKIDWVLGLNYVYDNLPDFRRLRTFRLINQPNNPFTIIDPPSSNLFDTSRFFSELDEYSVNVAGNYTYKIERVKDDEEFEPIVLKTGVFADLKQRDFNARYFSYLIPGGLTTERKNQLTTLPLSQAFAPENVNAVDGWVFREGTNPTDSYVAENKLFATYAYGELPISKFLITAGVRVEHNILTIKTQQFLGLEIIESPITSVLPSANISYNINERNVLRAAYFKSVNRPEFREISPFLFYNFEEDTEVIGAEDLTTANINNFDLRYEFYPTKGETLSFGVFYKDFSQPIEFILPVVAQQRRMRYSNTDSAFVYGAEVEVRKDFKNVFKTGFLSDLAINFNAAYVKSEIDYGNVVIAQSTKRALQGQSPYVINAALGYDNKDNGWNANVIYNRIGDRIYTVGNNLFPDIYELARHQLDFSISKTFQNTTYKFSVGNILNDKFRFWQDTSNDGKIDRNLSETRINPTTLMPYEVTDHPVFEHKLGAVYSFSVTYKF